MKKNILFFVFGFLSCTISAQTYKEFVRKGLDAAAMDSLDQAEDYFRQAMKTQPAQKSNALLFLHIGQIQETRKEFDKALESYTMGVHLSPRSIPILMQRAALYMQLNRAEKALVDYNDILDINPAHKDALLFRAYIYVQQRLYKRARIDYEQIIQDDPEHQKALLGLILLNEKDNRPYEAMQQINRLVLNYPDSAIYYVVRAGMEQERKLYELSLMDFEEAFKREPNNPDYYISRAALYLDMKKKKLAQKDLEKALELGADKHEVASFLHQVSE